MTGSAEYNREVLKHFRNPKNMGIIKNPDAESTIRNPSCGDVMKIMLKIKGNRIKDIKFQTMGCAAAIATSSVTTQLAKGKTLEQAKKITSRIVERKLGQLPPVKVHCSNLAADALREAIENWENKKQVHRK